MLRRWCSYQKQTSKSNKQENAASGYGLCSAHLAGTNQIGIEVGETVDADAEGNRHSNDDGADYHESTAARLVSTLFIFTEREADLRISFLKFFEVVPCMMNEPTSQDDEGDQEHGGKCVRAREIGL